MPNETLIAEIENMLSEIVRLGGENERSQMVPNLTVQNANPSGLDGFVIVSDDRDGDNILAKKVGSVIYSDNDLVNVIFPKGGEAIAFQQGSQSGNSDIWKIVPSTTTDIFYDKGNVGIGDSTPNAMLHVLNDTAAQQVVIAQGAAAQSGNIIEAQNNAGTALTYIEDDGKFVISDGSATLPTAAMFRTGSPSGTIPWALRQNAADSATPTLTWFETSSGNLGQFAALSVGGTGTFFLSALTGRQLGLSANNVSGTPHILINTSGDVGVGTSGPDAKLDVLDNSGAQLRLTFQDAVKYADFTVDTNHDLTVKPSSTGQVIFQPTTDSTDFFQVRRAAGSIAFNVDTANLRVGIGTDAPSNVFEVTRTTSILALFENTSASASNAGAFIVLGHNDGAAQADGDRLGGFAFRGQEDASTTNNSAAVNGFADGAWSVGDAPGRLSFETTPAGATSRSVRMVIKNDGNIGMNGITSPSTELDIGDGAIEFEEMTAPAAGAANTARLFTQDNGAGKTQLAVRFNTGAIQILATEP